MLSRSRILLKLIHTRYVVLDLPNTPREGNYGPQFLEAYGASHINPTMPHKEKDPWSFTLPCYINNVCFDNSLANLRASVSVMPLSTYLNLGLGELAHIRLIVELADKTVKYRKGIAENVLVGIGDDKIIFKGVKPASSIIKRVYMLSLRVRIELDLEARLVGETLVINRSLDPSYRDYIELNNLKEPLELMRNQVDDLMPTSMEGKKGNNVVGALVNVPIFVGTFSVITDFTILENMDAYRDERIVLHLFKWCFTQEHLDAICAKYFVPEEVYPQLPSSNATMHERPTGKIGMIVERAKAKNERPIVMVAKHRTVTLLPTSVVRSSGELSASVEREFVAYKCLVMVRIQGLIPLVVRRNVSHRTCIEPWLLQDSRLTVEQGVPALPTLPFITSSVTASPLEEGGDRTDSVTGPSLRTIGPSARSAAPVMTEATTVATVATTVAIPADVSKDKSAPHPSVFGSSSSSEKTDRTLSLFTGRSGSGFDAGSIRAEEAVGSGSEEIYVPKWTVTKGFELNDGRLCANMIDHFTPPAFFQTYPTVWACAIYL
ncbi:hypothetical protein Tco_1229188 [Tanacetum coccineum]